MIETNEYMSAPVITADVDDAVLHVTELMDKHNIGSVVIMQNDEIAGIVTERDIIRKVVAKNKDIDSVKAKDIMTADVKTLTSDASVMDVSGEMKEHVMRRIVVVEDKKPVGIITSRDIIGLLV